MITDEQAMGFFTKAVEAYQVAYNTIANNEAKDLAERIATAKPSADHAAAAYLKDRIDDMLAEKDAEIERLRVVLECPIGSCHRHGQCMYSPCRCPRAALKETQP